VSALLLYAQQAPCKGRQLLRWVHGMQLLLSISCVLTNHPPNNSPAVVHGVLQSCCMGAPPLRSAQMPPTSSLSASLTGAAGTLLAAGAAAACWPRAAAAVSVPAGVSGGLVTGTTIPAGKPAPAGIIAITGRGAPPKAAAVVVVLLLLLCGVLAAGNRALGSCTAGGPPHCMVPGARLAGLVCMLIIMGRQPCRERCICQAEVGGTRARVCYERSVSGLHAPPDANNSSCTRAGSKETTQTATEAQDNVHERCMRPTCSLLDVLAGRAARSSVWRCLATDLTSPRCSP
jgi:hypothetical protein